VRACVSNEPARKIGVDAPVALLVGIGETVARDATPKPQVIKLGLMCAQASFDVAQTLAIREKGKSQTQELIQAGETLHLVVALVAIYTTAKLGQRKQVHQLSGNRRLVSRIRQKRAEQLLLKSLISWQRVVKDREARSH